MGRRNFPINDTIISRINTPQTNVYPDTRDFLNIEQYYTEDNIATTQELLNINMKHTLHLIDTLKPTHVYIIPPLPREHRYRIHHYDEYNAAAYLLTLLLHDTLHLTVYNDCLIQLLNPFIQTWSISSHERKLMYTEFKYTNNHQYIHFTSDFYKEMYEEVIHQVQNPPPLQPPKPVTPPTSQPPTPSTSTVRTTTSTSSSQVKDATTTPLPVPFPALPTPIGQASKASPWVPLHVGLPGN